MADKDVAEGSIPAHTGKPSLRSKGLWRVRVYPRTHGETCYGRTALRENRGLSPHTRGNQKHASIAARVVGSIPAHTGKPETRCAAPTTRRVYPRTHGETYGCQSLGFPKVGLSPHTRGNPSIIPPQVQGSRSIPAHTGKPNDHRRQAVCNRVYPRTHGETRDKDWSEMMEVGLSPHTRGNRHTSQGDSISVRSIPAHTGKPIHVDINVELNGVYPRTHGETPRRTSRAYPYEGLSPHTRGNPWARARAAALRRRWSIPAHTGKPHESNDLSDVIEVYPRTHGETSWSEIILQSLLGLSPHTRGNQGILASDTAMRGSIPAHTGKPPPCRYANLP